MSSQTEFEIADRLRLVQERIDQALARSGRSGEMVRILAVTKTFSRQVADEALRAGLKLFGENRVQEAYAKFSFPPFQAELHLIGHLQTNKVKKAAQLFQCIQSIDKLETAQELNRVAAGLNKKIDILLQLNTSGEATKSGYSSVEALCRDLEAILELKALRLKGLMTIGPLTDDKKSIRSAFRRLKKLYDKLVLERILPPHAILSMGMSGDFELAVEEGANLVRLGTALFGERGS